MCITATVRRNWDDLCVLLHSKLAGEDLSKQKVMLVMLELKFVICHKFAQHLGMLHSLCKCHSRQTGQQLFQNNLQIG